MGVPKLAVLSNMDCIADPALPDDCIDRARRLAVRLDIPVLDSVPLENRYDFLLTLTSEGLSLSRVAPASPGPLRVDFDSKSIQFRQADKLHRQAIARAVGVKPGSTLTLLDGTAGLGRDAFLLASLGCGVLLLERHPVIHALLEDGLQRAAVSDCVRTRETVGRMKLKRISLEEFDCAGTRFDAVYLDPMFPQRRKSARVKKDMFILQEFFDRYPSRDEEDSLLGKALTLARKRVVVKRPVRAPALAGTEPSFQLAGRTSRYDVYLVSG